MADIFQDPARLFLESHSVDSLTDIFAYTDFLRQEAGLSCDPPISVDSILNRFKISGPEFINLHQQQGTTINKEDSIRFLINAGDSERRQKFSVAHELIELLFTALPGKIRRDRVKENIFGVRKEEVCQKGAAELIMPLFSFKPAALKLGLSFQSAETLAQLYDVSLMASICRMLDIYPKKGVMILWQMRNKPTEIKKEVAPNQLSLPGINPPMLPMKKLRVAWSYGDYRELYIPKDKSICDDSGLYKAYDGSQYFKVVEKIPFGRNTHISIVEGIPILIKGEKHILSLIRDK